MSRAKIALGIILEWPSISECHEEGTEICLGVPDPEPCSIVVSVKLNRLLGDIHEFCYFPGIHILSYEICHPNFLGCEVKDPESAPVGKGWDDICEIGFKEGWRPMGVRPTHFRHLKIDANSVNFVTNHNQACYYRDKTNPCSKSGWTRPEVVSFDVRVRITPI